MNKDRTHCLTNTEFKSKYCMDRDTLDEVTKRIEDHPIFKRGKRGPAQRPVKHQLMTLLHFLGREGESNISQRNTVKIGAGTYKKYQDKVAKALVDLGPEYIQWPDEEERKEIFDRIESKFVWQNCVGT